jgi:hypothetical protein
MTWIVSPPTRRTPMKKETIMMPHGFSRASQATIIAVIPVTGRKTRLKSPLKAGDLRHPASPAMCTRNEHQQRHVPSVVDTCILRCPGVVPMARISKPHLVHLITSLNRSTSRTAARTPRCTLVPKKRGNLQKGGRVGSWGSRDWRGHARARK